MFYTLIPTDRRAGQYSSNQPQQPVPFCVDILDQGDSYRMEAELPGFRKEEISLDLKGDLLTVTACHKGESQESQGKYLCRERHWGSYGRSFDVSEVQQSGITAAYENGVLKLMMPKKSAIQPQSSRIAID